MSFGSANPARRCRAYVKWAYPEQDPGGSKIWKVRRDFLGGGIVWIDALKHGGQCHEKEDDNEFVDRRCASDREA